MKLSYRVKTYEDEPALVRLWSDFGGWDQIDLATWRRRFRETPYEPCIAVAEDAASQEIVGQFIFFRFPLTVDGRELVAMRAFAPIISEKARRAYAFSLLSNPLQQPLAGMYRRAMQAMRQAGCHLIFALPDPAWVRLLRIIPQFQCDKFPLWSRPFSWEGKCELPPGFTAAPLNTFEDEVDELWELSRHNHAVSIVRDRRILQWRFSLLDYHVTALRRDGQLVGLVAAQQKGDRQWLICDVVSVDMGETFVAAVQAACLAGQAKAEADDKYAFDKVAILATPAMAPGLRQLNFAVDDYQFPLLVHVLDKSLARRDVAPARWYISAND